MKFSLPKGPITAAQLAELKAKMMEDPEYHAEVERVEAERAARTRRLSEAERPIVEDLNGVGVKVDSVWDLVNSANNYQPALPVLMEHLKRGSYPEMVIESLCRALAVKASVVYWDQLKEMYLSPRSSSEENGVAIALSACATVDQLEDMLEFLALPERGESRIYFIAPILKVGGPRARQIIEDLKKDAVLGKEARALLRKRRA